MPAPSATDGIIAGGFVLLSLAEIQLGDVPAPVVHGLVATTAMTLLAWRRHAPLLVAAAVVAAQSVVDPDFQYAVILAVVLVAYTIGAETRPPRTYVGLALLVVPFLIGVTLAGLEPSDLAAAFVFIVGPWAVGTVVSRRLATSDAAIERAQRIEREHAAEAAAALAAERTRIARELHDIVSHSISVITIQTQAVRRRLGPDHAAEARDLAAIEATARDAMAEMRRLLGVLRADGEAAALAPQPGLRELAPLVERARDAGLDVTVVVEGDLARLPAGVDLAAYRVVQEAVTNVLRHAHARRLRIEVRASATELELAVTDDGRGLTDGRARGHGLTGLEERVSLYGGRLSLHSPTDGGTRLSATLPLEEVPA